jgi:GNAT superfamily N-acetyltransferase
MTPSTLDIERATLSAVPAPRTAFDGPFVLRAFAGGTGRANSAISLDPAADPLLPERLPRIEAFYVRAGLRPRFRSTPLDPPGLRGALEARGYVAHDESQVMFGAIEGAAEAAIAADMLDHPTPDWMAVMAAGEHQVPRRQEEKRRMPEVVAVPAAWVLLRHEGAPAACAFVTADGPLAGVFDLAVRPDLRRRRLGRVVVAAGLDWARRNGARFAFAQVSCANAASLGLFASLGIAERYRYRYFLRD